MAIVATLRLGMLEQARGKLPRHLDIGPIGRKDFEDAILKWIQMAKGNCQVVRVLYL